MSDPVAASPLALPRARDAVANEPRVARWGARLFLAGEPPEPVGWRGPNASNHALGKVGLRFDAAAQEGDMLVWRFSLTRSTAATSWA